jgi:hypothetical protein
VAPAPSQALARRIRRRAIQRAPQSVSSQWDEGKHKRGAGGKFVTSNSSGAEAKGAAKKLGANKLTPELIRAYQKKHGLKVDGVIGHQTALALSGKIGEAKRTKTGALTEDDRKALRGSHQDGEKPKGRQPAENSTLSANELRRRLKRLQQRRQTAHREPVVLHIPRVYVPPVRNKQASTTIDGMTETLFPVFGVAVTKAIATVNGWDDEFASAPLDVAKKRSGWDEKSHPRGADGQFISKFDIVSVDGMGSGEVTSVGSNGKIKVKLESGKTVDADAASIRQSTNPLRDKKEVKQEQKASQGRMKEIDAQVKQLQRDGQKLTRDHKKAYDKGDFKNADAKRQEMDANAAQIRSLLDEKDALAADPTAPSEPQSSDGRQVVPDMFGAISQLAQRAHAQEGNPNAATAGSR